MYELPAYLVWGFLESGKSTLIKETLNQDYFNDGEKTMILKMCIRDRYMAWTTDFH